MPLSSDDSVVVIPLINHARLLLDKLKPDGSNTHTVAAVATTSTGTPYTGLNLYHFTGGPCAELVLLANAAADNAVSELTHIVAVGNEGRGVLNPCGRCRQVLVDLCPEVKVVCKGREGQVEVVEARELLPYVYAPPGD